MGLPRPILIRRIHNDLAKAEECLALSFSEFGDDVVFPLVMNVEVHGIRGYCKEGISSDRHSFQLIISADYPYERPKVKWTSEIFHPNIMSPSEGGLVCVKAIDHWDFDSDLSSFLTELTELIKNPNPHNPLNSETCNAAAEWFLSNVRTQ